MKPNQLKRIKEFQCAGCVNGSCPTTCGRFEWLQPLPGAFRCKNHVPGTAVFPGGLIALGLPKGFCRVGDGRLCVRIYEPGEFLIADLYDKFNVPVWAMECDGYLFVRVYSPRINATYVDIFPEGKLAKICPDAVNVGEFIDEID